MRKTVEIIRRTIKGRKKFYLALMLQLFISMFIINYSLAMINNAMSLEKYVSKTGFINFFCLTINERLSQQNDIQVYSENSTRAFVRSKIYSAKNIAGFGTIYTALSSVCNSKSYYSTLLTSKYLFENLKMPLSEGSWPKVTQEKDGTIPIIIADSLSSKYRVGDKVSLNFYRVTNKFSRLMPIQARVAGILKKSSYVIDAGGYCYYNLESFVKKQPDIIIMPYTKDILGIDIVGYTAQVFIAPGKGQPTKTFLTNLQNQFKGIGTVHAIKEAVDGYHANNNVLYLLIFVGIITMLLTIAGIGGINALYLIYSEKNFAIYYMFGMKWRLCVIITCIKDFFVIFIPGILAFIAAVVTNKMCFGGIMNFDFNTFVTSILCCIVIYIITSVEPLITLYKKDPIVTIRRWV